jgi:hypothetical protein
VRRVRPRQAPGGAAVGGRRAGARPLPARVPRRPAKARLRAPVPRGVRAGHGAGTPARKIWSL